MVYNGLTEQNKCSILSDNVRAAALKERRNTMNTTLALIIFCEILLTLGIVYGMLHEQKLIRFEKAVAARIRASLRRRKLQKDRRDREKFNARVTYTPVRPRVKAARSSKEAA